MSGMTVGLLKQILIKHNVSDDDVIEFHFTETPIGCREIEFDQIYKREFGILMDFIPTKLEENDDQEENLDDDYDPTPQYLWDDTGGEPPISADERHREAWEEKQRLKGRR